MTALRVLALAAGALVPAASGASAQTQPLLGQAAPGFRLADLEGRTLSLEELRGRFVVMHFGASW